MKNIFTQLKTSFQLIILFISLCLFGTGAFALPLDKPDEPTFDYEIATDQPVFVQSHDRGIDMARINPLLAEQQQKLEKFKKEQAKAEKQASKKTAKNNKQEKTSLNVAKGVQQVELEQYQAQMKVDLARLKEVKNIDDKARLKKEFLETYKPFLDKYVTEKHKYPNDVLVQNMIWLFDTGATVDGLMLGIFLTQQGCHVTPAKFGRDIPTFICDEVYDAFIKQVKDDQFNEEIYSSISHVLETIVNDKWSLAPPVHSKMYALAAKYAKGLERWQECRDYCQVAIEVNPEGHGVKKLLEEALTQAPLAGAGEETST